MKHPFITISIVALTMTQVWAQPIESTFTLNDDGWRDVRVFDYETFTNFAGPLFSPPYGSSAGNPDGAISCSDIHGDAGCEFVAPPKFLGDKSSFYGGSFSWDYKSTGGTDPADTLADLVLVGSGMILFADVGSSPPTGVWVRRIASLREGTGWRLGTPTGRTPTAAEFQSVLTNLQGIFIESDLAGDADTGFLDNVVMSNGPGIPALLDITLHAGIHVTGTVGKVYRVEYATELPAATWFTLTNLTLPSSPYLLFDPSPANAPKRYYRATALP